MTICAGCYKFILFLEINHEMDGIRDGKSSNKRIISGLVKIQIFIVGSNCIYLIIWKVNDIIDDCSSK